MTLKAGNWMIAVGAVTMFFGLCCMPAALGEHPDTALLGVGASIFAMGALFIASGIYAKARAWQSLGVTEAESAPAQRTRGGCELCGSDVPVVQCRVHQLQLCSTCLAEHFDPRSCSYIPPARRATGKGMSRARGA
jgi:hypothetical protein